MSSFAELGLSPETLEILAEKNYQTPTPIQEEAIPLLLEGGHDFIGQAQTGTGKTAAFALPIIEKIHHGNSIKAMVISPTRELALQTAGEMKSLIGNRKLKCGCFFGGQPIFVQLRAISNSVDIAVGTPGRLIDLIERGKLKLDLVEYIVLDEADEMLDMGFIEDIEKILSLAPEEKRIMLFSATMPAPIKAIAEKFLRAPITVNTRNTEENRALTKQYFYNLYREEKLDALLRLIDMDRDMYAMIFCRTKDDVNELTSALKQRMVNCEALHGDIAQNQRTLVITAFKQKAFRILVATDVAARGIDVNDLTHVINFALPHNAETYLHRIGRTGRAGRTGTAITFVTPGEKKRFLAINQQMDQAIRKAFPPSGKEMVAYKKSCFTGELTELVKHPSEECQTFAAELLESFPPETLIAALIQREMKDALAPAQELTREPRKEFDQQPQRPRRYARNSDRNSDRNFDRPERKGRAAYNFPKKVRTPKRTKSSSPERS
ncbi:MAG: DEAD/DEAH box helicase [Victivallaceae bacterium]|nr:DEAD/DEAH box helicase [Victivallaceae bacterium]